VIERRQPERRHRQDAAGRVGAATFVFRLSRPRLVFFLVVWLTEQVELPLLGIGVPWPWKWGIRENLIDAWHHVAYAAGTTLSYLALGHL